MFERFWGEDEERQRQRLLQAQLAKVIERHLFVQVRLDKSQEVQRSLLLELDRKTQSLWLDQLMPRVGLSRLQEAVWTVSWRDQGVMWRFHSRMLEVRGRFPEQTYRLQMPVELSHHQRRGAFRVQLHADMQVPVMISLPGERHYKGWLRDLSASGLRAEFDTRELGQLLQVGGQIEPCLLALPEGVTVEVRLELSNIIAVEKGGVMLCGKLEVLDARARHQLERFIASMQRLEQRRIRGFD